MTETKAPETWSIGDLARLSGVTSRTLRHYDEVGLVRPVGTAAGGRRLYDRTGLLRLQQVLVLRELDVGLDAIADLLATDDDAARLALLREHHDRLLTEADRHTRLAATVAATIDSLDGGPEMTAKDLYEGFDHTQYDAEARQKYGDRAVEESNATWERLGPDGQAAHHREFDAINRGLADLMAAGTTADDAVVQALIARHLAQIALFWTPTAESYAGLGQMYVDDERFAANYESVRPGLGAYLRDAMAVHADHM